jgi:cation diffusion facilitator CzcD-associated flavoprotein CzcO
MWMPMSMRQPRIVSRILQRLPKQDKTVQLSQFIGSDYLVDLVIRPTWRRRLAQRYGWMCLRAMLRDKALRAKLTPDYQPFCKRQVLSGDYYRRISRPNASFVSEPIAESPHPDCGPPTCGRSTENG